MFAVQYAGMSQEAIRAAVVKRSDGVCGGMPAGATLTATEAVDRWLAGERSYLRVTLADGKLVSLGDEPLFVTLGKGMTFSIREMHAEYVGAVYRELGLCLYTRPDRGRLPCTGGA